jgi:hypothetical protein
MLRFMFATPDDSFPSATLTATAFNDHAPAGTIAVFDGGCHNRQR